jgi:hypothetical protein
MALDKHAVKLYQNQKNSIKKVGGGELADEL